MFAILNKDSDQLVTLLGGKFCKDRLVTDIDYGNFCVGGYDCAGVAIHNNFDQMLRLLAQLLIQADGNFEIVELKWA